MNRISSRTDIETYVANTHPDFDGALADALVYAIQQADHPAFGEDWEPWLDANAADLRVAAARALEPPPAYVVQCRVVGGLWHTDDADRYSARSTAEDEAMRLRRVEPTNEGQALEYRVVPRGERGDRPLAVHDERDAMTNPFDRIALDNRPGPFGLPVGLVLMAFDRAALRGDK